MKNSNNYISEENKRLLLIDLCARLPYGVIVHNEEGYDGHLNSINQTIFGIELGVNITATHRVDFQLDTCKPYLRLISSITEEEIKELESISRTILIPNIGDWYKWLSINPTFVDYLNSHYLDWRGLIPMGLALEAPKEMYIINI